MLVNQRSKWRAGGMADSVARKQQHLVARNGKRLSLIKFQYIFTPLQCESSPPPQLLSESIPNGHVPFITPFDRFVGRVDKKEGPTTPPCD